jgi:hypothetical protein
MEYYDPLVLLFDPFVSWMHVTVLACSTVLYRVAASEP